MRQPLTPERLERFMTELGARVKSPARVYFTGGATAVLHGWRATTIDLDLKIVAAEDAVFRELPHLKEILSINIELAAPDNFIPELPGWDARSRFVARHGAVEFFEYDFYSQALSKIERGHERDLHDVDSMARQSLIEPKRLLELFRSIESQLFRFPAIDPPSFRRAVESWMESHSSG